MKISIVALVMFGCGSSSAPEPKPAPPAPSPSPAPAPVAVDAAVAAPSVDAAAAAGSRGPKATFAKVPDGWTPDADPPDQMTLLVATNETAFPVDNALFSVRYGLEDPDAPTKDPKAYAAWLGKSKSFVVVKTQTVPRGTYFESKDAFRYALSNDGQAVWCGGSLYRDKDYNKIPKLRDQSVAAAKQLCASVEAR